MHIILIPSLGEIQVEIAITWANSPCFRKPSEAMMSQLLSFLWCIAFIMMAGILVRGHPIADQTSNNTEDKWYYNIYSKIDSLEKSLQNLQTGVQNRNKLLQQVFLAIGEFGADPAMTDVNLKSLVLQTKGKNGNFISSFLIIYFHCIYLVC